MKQILICILLISFLNAQGQLNTDSLSNPAFSLEDSVAEKLAQLVTQYNPNVKVLDKRIEADKYEWKRNKLYWIPNVTASFNINERNINKVADSSVTLYPRYNLGLTVPLTNLITGPKASKAAYAQYESSIATRNVGIESLKEQVRIEYKNYQVNRYLLALQESVLQDESILLSQVEQKFQRNEINLEIFNAASKRYNAELVKKLNLLRDVSTSKIHLENLLGMELENALRIVMIRK